MKSQHIVWPVLVAAAVLAGVLITGRHPQPAEHPVAQIALPSPVVSTEATQVTAPDVSVPKKTAVAPIAQMQSAGSVVTGKASAQDPDARVALSLVGVDPAAEQYWTAAINDPTLPAEERKDLIEDLNEDGLSDPKHPGPQDMPLIMNRIRLIEELGPYAMDSVNAKAFDEAYKDLVNLASGGPVD